MYCKVIVDVVHSNVDRIFEYDCPFPVQAGHRVRVPFNTRTVEGYVLAVSDKSEYPADKLKSVVKILDDLPALTAEAISLSKKIVERYNVPVAAALRLFVPAVMRSGVKEKFVKFVTLGDGGEQLVNTQKRREVYDYIKEKGAVELRVLREMGYEARANALISLGALKAEMRREMRTPEGFTKSDREKVLTAAQNSAIETFLNTKKRVTLIHGVTGSGKTEVYLNVIASAVKSGKTAIFLVPEISLTPQMFAQLKLRFGESVAILHSGLSDGERFDEWWRLRDGTAKIAVGARSAVFAPLENLGVIVIDEEHESSYYSEQSPRYSTLEIAKMRAEYNGCKLLLGSATPSIETFVKANSGDYELVTLSERINKKPMPEFIVADMRQEVRRGNNTCFSQVLREELKNTLDGGNQAILFLNRRGYSTSAMCRECGHVFKCDSCDVSLTYHKQEGILKCHYCGKAFKMTNACPECGSYRVGLVGVGTERLVEDLKKFYPAARILRMDADTVTGKNAHLEILKKFADHEADILVGTQMIAKGHDFPSVNLVGIIDADMSLFYSDYRSSERTFQLITQVAGRSGRAGVAGKTVLQTYNPENVVLRYAIDYDYKRFFESESSLRQATGFPPFSIIVRIMVVGADNERTLGVLREVYGEVQEVLSKDSEEVIFLNRMHSPKKVLKAQFRYQVLMRLKTNKFIPELQKITEKYSTDAVLVYIEENPQNLT